MTPWATTAPRYTMLHLAALLLHFVAPPPPPHLCPTNGLSVQRQRPELRVPPDGPGALAARAVRLDAGVRVATVP